MLQTMDLANGRVSPNAELTGNVRVYVNPDETERKYLVEVLKLDEHTLASALDPDELARLGKDWRRVFDQLEREQAVAKEKELTFTEDDNMMNAATGAPREKEAKDEKDDGSEDNTNA